MDLAGAVAEPYVIEIDPGLRPIDAFLAISRLPHPFFLDSGVDGDCDGVADYSIVGADPFRTASAAGNRITLSEPLRTAGDCASTSRIAEAGPTRHVQVRDPFTFLGQMLRANRVSAAADLPFVGGAVGYLGYDLRHFVEKLPRTAVPDVDAPDLFFGLYDAALVFDHTRDRVFAVANGLPQRGKAGELRARRRAGWLAAAATASSRPAPQTRIIVDRVGARSNFTRRAYLDAVARVREYIFAGDIYQANLSQRFEVGLHADAVALYGRLRSLSPAPFGAYIDAGPVRILSNSPERFLQHRGKGVQTRPIKGTIRRMGNPADDRRVAADLLASAKDSAEHLMIVDLERNDLGKVCTYGSVFVEELAHLESYQAVHHLVSTISGHMRAGTSTEDLLRATFPGGSITGAPKVRAMEIIDELEPTARGVYTGAIGYLSFCGSIDLNIAIRTLVHNGRTAFFQAGGGIVADSKPADEYTETLDKAHAFFTLLSSASEGE